MKRLQKVASIRGQESQEQNLRVHLLKELEDQPVNKRKSGMRVKEKNQSFKTSNSVVARSA